MRYKNIVVVLSILLLSGFINAQVQDSIHNKNFINEQVLKKQGPIKGSKLNKVTGESREIKDIIIKGNKITTILYNYGSVCAPNVLANVQDLVWNGLGYGFEFGTLAGAEVLDVNGDTLHIVSDSHVLATQGDYNADASLKWGWLPKAGYTDPNQSHIASLNAEDTDGDGKPDSWPESWYSRRCG